MPTNCSPTNLMTSTIHQIFTQNQPPSKNNAVRIQRKRLRTLAEFLVTSRKVRKHFNLYGWVNTPRFTGPDGEVDPTVLRECGATACACGWAATIPALRRQGFSMSWNAPAFGDYRNWIAVEKFFGLSERDSEELFSVGNYKAEDADNPRAVAARIFEFLEHA